MGYMSLYTIPWSSKCIIQHHSTLLLTKYRNDSKDVLEDIGCVQHEILLQIALFKNAKMEKLLTLLMAFILD